MVELTRNLIHVSVGDEVVPFDLTCRPQITFLVSLFDSNLNSLTDIPCCVTGPSVVPWYMTYAPAELLDRHLDVSCCLHAAQLQSAATTQPQNTSAMQSQSSVSADVLQHELSLLHAELMFERQRREVHARRGRRLLAHISQLNSLADQNEAMVSDSERIYLTM